MRPFIWNKKSRIRKNGFAARFSQEENRKAVCVMMQSQAIKAAKPQRSIQWYLSLRLFFLPILREFLRLFGENSVAG
jgi:hypothetical protein